MKIFIIERIGGSAVPFRMKAKDEEEALEKVFEHMGSDNYHVVNIEIF